LRTERRTASVSDGFQSFIVIEILDAAGPQLIEHPMHILLQILIDIVGHTVARFALPLLSFGRIYIQPLTAPPSGFNFLGYRRDQTGRIEIESTAAGSIGLVICLIVAFAFALLIRGSL
jgi:hypothetical protein